MNLRRFSGSVMTLALIGLVSQATSILSPALADVPDLIPMPNAGAVLGWELNMNKNYSRSLDPQISQPSETDESPIILDDKLRKQLYNNDSPLNIPNPSAKPPSIQP